MRKLSSFFFSSFVFFVFFSKFFACDSLILNLTIVQHMLHFLLRLDKSFNFVEIKSRSLSTTNSLTINDIYNLRGEGTRRSAHVLRFVAPPRSDNLEDLLYNLYF